MAFVSSLYVLVSPKMAHLYLSSYSWISQILDEFYEAFLWGGSAQIEQMQLQGKSRTTSG